MIEHPNFINVRRLAIIMALGPCALLLIIFTLDVSLAGVNRLIASRSNCAASNVTTSSVLPTNCP